MSTSDRLRTLVLIPLALFLSGCVGTAIGVATDTAIAVGKVPFKVGGAVIDVASGEEEKAAEDEDRTPKER